MFTHGVQFSVRETIKYTLYRKCVPKSINIIEVGLRDGLQNESKIFTISEKKQLLDLITDTGLKNIEIGSFVSPKWIPQLRDTDKLIQSISQNDRSKLYLSALVPNLKGLQTAIQSNVNEIVLFVAVSDEFNKRNINCTTDIAFERFVQIANVARNSEINIRGSISTCFSCPYSGKQSIQSVVEVVKRFIDLGVTTVDIADTIGTATPKEVEELFIELLKHWPSSMFACHYHDTNNIAIKNVEMSYNLGITNFHSSIAGLGGCPYSSKRVGNLDTIKLVKWAHDNNIHVHCNPDIAKLEKTAEHIHKMLQLQVNSI